MIPHWKQKFALLWTGQALSILSSMISQYALIWYLTDLTGSPAILSLATMAALVPQGILSLFTGTFADRFDRRWIMMISDGAIGLVSLMLAAAPLPLLFRWPLSWRWPRCAVWAAHFMPPASRPSRPCWPLPMP